MKTRLILLLMGWTCAAFFGMGYADTYEKAPDNTKADGAKKAYTAATAETTAGGNFSDAEKQAKLRPSSAATRPSKGATTTQTAQRVYRDEEGKIVAPPAGASVAGRSAAR